MRESKKTESRKPPGYCLSDWLNQVVPFPGKRKIWEIDQDQLEDSCNDNIEWKTLGINNTVCPAWGRSIHTNIFRRVYITCYS